MELLIDGVRYKLWTPKDEAALENIVKEHAKDIFGEDSVYFDIKQKIKSKAGIGSIPDGYVIALEDTPRWYIVEVELSSHPLYDHIVPQMSKFSRAINDPNTQRALVDAIYDEIKNDALKQTLVENKIGSREKYEFLFRLISSRPTLVVVIEEKTEVLEDVCNVLPLETKVVEFRTFVREGVGLAGHAHLFKPLHKPHEPPKKVTVQDLLNAGLVQSNQKILMDYKGKTYWAEILSSGEIKLLHDNTEHHSLSGASDYITGTSTDGWRWWYNYDENGRKCKIDDLRKKLRQQ